MRKLLYACVAAGCLSFVAAELFSYAMLTLEQGQLIGWNNLQQRRLNSGEGGTMALLDAMNSATEQDHPYVGYTYRPQRRAGLVTQAGEPTTLIGVSEWGLRDDKSPIQKRSPEHLIVGIFGASVASTFAFTGVGELKRQLESEFGRQVLFVNTAIGGYKQPQPLMMLSYLLALGGEFDIVVNIDGYNDVALTPVENLRAGTHPAYPRLWALRAGWQDLAETIGEITVTKRKRERWADFFSRAPQRYSFTANLVWSEVDQHLASRLHRKRLELKQRRADSKLVGPPYTHGTGAGMYAYIASLWARSSRQMHALCEAHECNYFHFLQPIPTLSSKPMGREELEVVGRTNADIEPGHAEKGYPYLQREARRLLASGVRFRDLSGVFQDVREQVYVDPYCHVNKRGNEVLGRAIANYILEALRSEAQAP
jgi:hypothetical protein